MRTFLDKLLQHNAEWRKRTGLNENGQPSFGSAVSIKCRKVEETKMRITPLGEVYTDDVVYLVTSLISIGDELDGITVKSVRNVEDHTNRVIFREVSTTWKSMI